MSNSSKVLIVEDEEVWSSIYVSTISPAGYLPYVAGDIDTALTLMDRHFFHAALLDIVLAGDYPPGEQGMQILEKVMQLGETTGLIMITAHPSYSRMDRAYAKFGVSRFLMKDTYQRSELIEELSKATEEAKAYLEIRRREDLQPHNLLHRFAVRDLEASIRHRPAGRLLDLLQSLVRYYVPLVVCGKFERFDIAGESSVFETRYWSRFAGKEIVVRIGHRARIRDEANQLKETIQDVFVETRQDISGLRYFIEGSSPDAFRDCVE